MSFKSRIIFYALLPLIFITGVMFFLISYQIDVLSSKELTPFKTSLLEAKKREVFNYITLAKTAIQPILDHPDIDEKSAQKQVKNILNNLKYAHDDGYFFVYDQQGINIVHPVLKHIVGENLYHQNNNGDFVIQSLLKLANSGGGFHTYKWNKPSTGEEQKKISYVVKLDRWNWVLGTGFYLDEIFQEITHIESQVISNISKVFYIVLVVTIFSTVLLGFLINWREGFLANLRLRELARRYVLLQVKERRGYARELHDNVGQLMVATKYDIELAIYQENNQQGCLNALERSKNNVNKAIHDIRCISHGLRPSLLDDMGLEDALKNLLNQCRKRTRMLIEIDYQISNIKLSEETEITLYRIIQEGVTNIEKHAEAHKIVLKLRIENNTLILDIHDDGKGFFIDKARKQKGIGLQNMRERAELLGGYFHIKTSKKNGTQIRFELPEAIKR